MNLGPFQALTSPAAHVLGYTLLLLTHATIVIVMLLNIRIAILNKTMGAHMTEAKIEATVVFPEYVLHMKKTTTPDDGNWSLNGKSGDVFYSVLEETLRSMRYETSNQKVTRKAIAKRR
ncbi:hypothetical protein SPRG_05567 [Saprolegnia parasitica CBS 223.65]|uniref:Uncharacterized protein n=1 Tax=Saprolegnia parasitica (strain CBS 223.65) TaxID=695850 RepID=A0A067CFU3_SAPPC|nr:hypothetical protein SPRG_05567 [Saprolegnia parasitica CBS 223.65]KDO29614.1 hypothetical protein SPRG_05567 [Saprolegnia parasitica CBS 223.65]|eukprot:XP_012199674.1 hypothetical protein SPRG_05567 [Saprolegnia parasitica CBS 223.65]